MAKFQMKLPDEIYKEFNLVWENCPKLFEEMTQAGAEVVYREILHNMGYAFKDTSELARHLQITKPYRTYGGKFVNTKVAFYGYYRKNDRDYINRKKATTGHSYRTGYKGNTTRMSSGRKAEEYTQEGVPVPLIIAAREFGTSSGEKKKPFVRKAFSSKGKIESAMKKAETEFFNKYVR